ncbi:MAG TPA: hypothetical protein DHW82_11635 [Spirochaetia bacterium]|nr:MAG: hypothetical protein A2Y41_09575 [Spirochaetes bacterium GWB1_36_13]HCL57643.1 hypothetical protein [Spirochaetia bacterium]
MKSSFSFQFLNSPFEDSALLAVQNNSKDDLLFDLGDLGRTSTGQMLRVRWVLITHTHIDHFAGFPRFLRVVLSSGKKKLSFYGPSGFIENFSCALHAYQWNLIDEFDIVFEVFEVNEKEVSRALFDSKKGFEKEYKEAFVPNHQVLLETENFLVSYEILDHKTPVLGFRLEEKEKWAVDKEKLLQENLCPGSWIKEIKNKIENSFDQDQGTLIENADKKWTLKEWKEKIFIKKEGNVFTYLTDFRYDELNRLKAVRLADHARKLFIESNFLREEEKNAFETAHLTAFQAGEIAGEAKVQEVRLFHFSNRYKNREELFKQFYDEMNEGRASRWISEEKKSL